MTLLILSALGFITPASIMAIVVREAREAAEDEQLEMAQLAYRERYGRY